MSGVDPGSAYRLGPWRVFPELGCLEDGGRRVHLEPRLMRLLTLLVEANGGSVRRDQLFAGIWPNQLIADQTLDSAVSRLRSKLGDDPKAPSFIQTLPKRGYRLLVSATPCLGAPADPRPADLALEHAGPQNPDSARPPDTGQDRRSPMPRKAPIFFSVCVLTIAAASGYWLHANSDPAPSVPPAPTMVADVLSSVAVLPFAHVDDDPDTTYVSDGIAEELLNQLAQVGGLQVASRTSSFRFREGASAQLPDIREIGRALGVRFLIEGSVRRRGDELRVTVQLIDAREGFHRWSHTYEGQWDDVFGLQLGMTQDIVKQIAPQLTLPSQIHSAAPGDSSPRARDLYLLGRHYWHQRQPDSLRQALSYFEQSAQADPQFALAYTGLADTYLLMVDYAGLPLDQAIGLAEPELAQALALAPNLADSRLALGHLHSLRGEWRQAEHELRRALALNASSASAHMQLGNVFNQTGRLDQALFSYREALRLDPLHATSLMNLSQAALKLGLYAEARQHLQRARELFPAHAYLFGLSAHLAISAGDLDSAHALLKEWERRPETQSPAAAELNDAVACGMLGVFADRLVLARKCLEIALAPNARSGLQGGVLLLALNHQASALASLGEHDEARDMANQARELGRQRAQRFEQSENDAYELAVAESFLGHREAAIDALLLSLQLGRRDLGWIEHDRRIRTLLALPALQGALEQLELAQATMRSNVETLPLKVEH